MISEIFDTDSKSNPSHPFPPKAGRRVGHPQRLVQESEEGPSGLIRAGML